MQDLGFQREKRTPKNYHIPPKNYQLIVFRLKKDEFTPVLVIKTP